MGEVVPGVGTEDPGFLTYWGFIDDPAAFWSGFRMRLVSDGSGIGLDNFFIDDFWATCGQVDGDGDGVPPPIDCDDSDINHWSDCGLCIDGDGDDFGDLCDLGNDCDDGDAAVNPLALDVAGDGIDQDCSNVDGPGFYDGFEDGTPAIGVWQTVSGDATVTTANVAAGTYALDLGGGIGIVETWPMDATTCPSLAWGYMGKRGPEVPDAGDGLNVEYWDGVSWVLSDRWEGDGTIDPAFTQRGGIINDPAAFRADFQIRLISNGSGVGFDNFFVDEFFLGCDNIDADGDLFPDFLDCAPYDPAHWSDCGLCVDLDGDFFGLQCDYGDDCDDADPAVNPEGLDLGIDGVDQDCDAIDGLPLAFDAFDSGAIDPLVWAIVSGDGDVTGLQSWSPSFSLRLGGGVGIADTAAVDTTLCANVAWSFMGKRGPETPDVGDNVSITYWDGVAWMPTSQWMGAGATDITFSPVAGVIVDPLAISPTFQLRLQSNGSGAGFDDFFLDDFSIGCAP